MTRTVHQIGTELKALRAKADSHRKAHYEGDEMATPFDSKIDALSREFRAAHAAEKDAEWSRENTIARRAEFKAELAKITRPVFADVACIQDRLGYRMQDLNEAIKRHGIA